MKKYPIIAALAAILSGVFLPNLYACGLNSGTGYVTAEADPRIETALRDGWKFARGNVSGAEMPDFDDSAWRDVTVPHDWAIEGPFSMENDLQRVQVVQDLETKVSLKTGRTGGLPYVGTGWYRRHFSVPAGKSVTLLFDGAMSEAEVYVNGTRVCFWPYGYSAFHCDVTQYVKDGDNVLAVKLDNKPFSTRWYPGAGLYRNVHLICTSPEAHVPVWGTCVTTPSVSETQASVSLAIKTEVSGKDVVIEYVTDIYSPEGKCVASRRSMSKWLPDVEHRQQFVVDNPDLWSPEHPNLYKAVTKLYVAGVEMDTYETVFGIRKIEFIPEEGFYLNGEKRKFKGVCNHHDLGPLGAAVSEAALRHQVGLLKDMGCDAIRTSHNVPAPELVRLCDEMGLMMMVESFDEWNDAKCVNGYHRFFDEWAEKDMVNMLHEFRNSPSVVMWSIGNEVPTQIRADGYKTALFLQGICHREDPTRPVTCGLEQWGYIFDNGFASVIDIPGVNYHSWQYLECHERLPQGFILGSETASTVSSRGVYHFPPERAYSLKHPDQQSSSYDLEACKWSNIPDVDFALADDYPWTMGQFVWTGFDYLGEPTPYGDDSWPNHSSMFGIIDLASIPKDRYYLYRSAWNRESPTLHIVPHWTWPDREGVATSVYVYTSYPEAELFLNGKSMGKRSKRIASAPTDGNQKAFVEDRYRLMWNDIVYEPGELKVVAYDDFGNAAMEKVVRTAGKPYAVKLDCDRERHLVKDGQDLAYVTVSVVDRNGNAVPGDTREIFASVTGSGRFRAVANGDPTCLESFQEPHMHLFSGKLTVIVQSNYVPCPESGQGSVPPAVLTVKAKGLKSASIEL